jgi:Glutathione S-transferase, N-terminal domain
MSLHLVIGNKNYSSWSFRPWLAMKVAGLAFDETVISLDAADFKTRVMELGGSGRVPVLIDSDVRVWESLAILEYLAEKFPASRLWPESAAARAHARTIGGAPGKIPRARCGYSKGRGAHRRDLGRMPKQIWLGRSIPVWLIRRRRCYVCSCRVAISHLRS